MYWRIGGVEQLELGLNVDSRTSTGRQRPRSSTYSGIAPPLTSPTTISPPPANLSNAETPAIRRWVQSPCTQLLAGIGTHGVYLWNVRPFALLSSLTYDTCEFGDMVDIVWAPGRDVVFVVLAHGYIYEIAVQRREPVLEYAFATQHYYARGPGEEHGIIGQSLVQQRTYRLPLGTEDAVVCAGAGPKHMLIATRAKVYRVTWTGALAGSIDIDSVYTGALIVQLAALDDEELFVFGDGTVRIASAGSVRALGTGSTTCVAYSAIAGMVAVGTSEGAVELYGCTDSGLEHVAHAEFQHGHSAVAALRWTGDGAAVASAHKSGHVVVRSALGYELNVTQIAEPAEYLAWTGMRLVAVAARRAAVLGFARAGSGGLCLHTDDKVMVHLNGAWRVDHAPTSVINGGVCVAAAGDGGVAVAGTRGMAVRLGGRWRTARAADALECTALAWSGSHVVAACVDHARDGAAQLMFWAPRSLDLPVESVELDAPAAAVSAHGAVVMAVSTRGVLHEIVAVAADTALHVTRRRTVDLAAAGIDPRRVRAVHWVPGAQAARAAVLVVEGTRLRVVANGSVRDVGRAEYVTVSGVNVGGMHSAVWWFDGSRLAAALVSLDDFMAGGAHALAAERARMHVAADFYPLAIATERGAVEGIDQDAAGGPCSGLAQLPVRARLFLHAVLALMLRTAEADALMYAACFEHRACFSPAMEMLLHDALEHDELPRTLRLLASFDTFDDIVVHAARTVEAAAWPRLFAEIGGGAAHVFARCLRRGRLRTAAQCLLIVHTMEPPSVAERCILALLAQAAKTQDRDLCVDVLRFLRRTAAADSATHAIYARLLQSAH